MKKIFSSKKTVREKRVAKRGLKIVLGGVLGAVVGGVLGVVVGDYELFGSIGGAITGAFCVLILTIRTGLGGHT